MIQKKYPARWERKEPWKFIPRRDLFPDVELSSDSEQVKTANKPRPSPMDLPEQPNEHQNNQQKTRPGIRPMAPSETELPFSQPRTIPEKKSNTPIHQLQRSPSSTMKLGDKKPAKKLKKGLPLPIDRPMTAVQSKRRASPGFLLLLFGGFLLLEFLESQAKGPTTLGGSEKHETVQMLKAIGPYLDDPQQDALYTAAGVMETIQMVKDVMNHTYQNQQRATIMNVPPNPRVRKVEAIKAIRPYIPPDNRKQLNQVLNFYEGADKVHRNFKAFQNNQILKEGQKTSLLELVTDILNVIHPVLPQEQRDQAEKASQIIKMIEVMGAVNKGSKKERRQHAQKAEDEKSKAKKIKEENPSDSSEQINKIMDSFAPMLNDEQKESMNMIMKMAQLLSQPDQGTNTDPDGN